MLQLLFFNFDELLRQISLGTGAANCNEKCPEPLENEPKVAQGSVVPFFWAANGSRSHHSSSTQMFVIFTSYKTLHDVNVLFEKSAAWAHRYTCLFVQKAEERIRMYRLPFICHFYVMYRPGHLILLAQTLVFEFARAREGRAKENRGSFKAIVLRNVQEIFVVRAGHRNYRVIQS